MSVHETAGIDGRVRALRLRTLAVGLAGVVLALAGVVFVASALGDAWRELHRGAQAGGVAFHLTPALQARDRGHLLPLLCVALAAVGTWGMTTGRIRRAHCALAYGLMLAVAAAEVAFAPPLRQPMYYLPSPIERMFESGRYTEVERIVDELPQLATHAAYVKSQIALRTRDRAALLRHGAPLLALTDALAYRGHDDPGERGVLTEQVGDFRVEVVAAIDRTLNGAATTEAALAMERRTQALGAAWAHVAVFAACGVRAQAAATALTLVWRAMRANLIRILDLLAA